jgi:hypothetical protein
MFDRDEHAHARACAHRRPRYDSAHAKWWISHLHTFRAQARVDVDQPVIARDRVSARHDAHARTDIARRIDAQQKWCATCDDARDRAASVPDAKEPGSDEPGSSGAAPSRFELPLPP